MKLKRSALVTTVLAVACSALPLQVLALEDTDARREILKLRDRLKEINNRIDNEVEQMARRIDPKADDKKVNALFTDLEKLRNLLRGEVAELRGQVEVIDHKMSKALEKMDKLENDLANTQKRERDVYKDFEQRLSRLEPRRQTIDGVEHDISPAEQKMFDEASALLKKKDFAAATQAFQNFLQRYPTSGYLAQAYYLMGSAYFADGDCKNAMSALQTVINRFPMTQRAPDAMLNLAICQDELNDKAGSRDTLEALAKKYPDSSAGKTAKSKLGTLK